MHYFKLVPGDHRALWENREALEKYLKRLKELMEPEDDPTYNDFPETDGKILGNKEADGKSLEN